MRGYKAKFSFVESDFVSLAVCCFDAFASPKYSYDFKATTAQKRVFVESNCMEQGCEEGATAEDHNGEKIQNHFEKDLDDY